MRIYLTILSVLTWSCVSQMPAKSIDSRSADAPFLQKTQESSQIDFMCNDMPVRSDDRLFRPYASIGASFTLDGKHGLTVEESYEQSCPK